jgi:hypothetical protein
MVINKKADNFNFCSLSAWVFVILGDGYNPETHSWNYDASHFFKQQDVWFVFGMTVS